MNDTQYNELVKKIEELREAVAIIGVCVIATMSESESRLAERLLKEEGLAK